MSRDFYINGESLVSVKGRDASGFGTLTQLGLSEGPIVLTFDFRHRDINLDAWGREIPADVQWMLASVSITIPFIHFDPDVLASCLMESMGGAPAFGQTARAGQRMGGGAARFAAGNRYIGLNLSSPGAARPWRFYFSYLTQTPVSWPLGTEKSIVTTHWRAIPYTTDPWNGGLGAQGAVIWDNTADS